MHDLFLITFEINILSTVSLIKDSPRHPLAISLRPRSDRAIAIAIVATCGSVANAKTIAIIASTADRSYRYRCRYRQYRQFLGYDTKFIVWRRLQEKNYRFCRQCNRATRATRAINAQNYRQYRFYRSCRLRVS